MGSLRLRPGRLGEGVADHRALLVAAGDPLDVASGERALDEVVEPVPVALLEGRALCLPVVGEDDQLVGPRRVAAGTLDLGELVVELAQRLERVGALEAGVVGDLVVAREGRVDRRSAPHEVGEHARDDQVADEHAESPSHQGVDAAAVAARPDVAADRAQRRRPLEEQLPHEEDERARDVVAVGEKRPVAGVRLLLGLHPADGEDHLVRLAGEEVAAAGAPVDEEPDPGRVPPLDLLAVGRCRARHQPRRLLLHPAECGDVLVRPEEDPRLARARLGGEIRLPLHETMRALREPARHRRRVPVPHRPAQHGQRKPVDLEVHHSRDVGRGDDPLAARDPMCCADLGPCRRARRSPRARR